MSEVARAARLLRAGELVAFPTETVYGLGADASNPRAVGRIFAAKGRPADHPLIVHLADAARLDRWAVNVPPAAHALAAAFWPGPLTLILERHPSVSDAVTGGQRTIGLRVPNHPLALRLLREFAGADGGGLAAPSANRFGHVSPTIATHVRDELGDAVAMVLDGGPCAVGIESTILDLSGGTPRILRPGMLDAAALATVLGAPPATGGDADAPRVSGSLEAHYAPRTALRLVPATELAAHVRDAADDGRRIAVLAAEPDPGISGDILWRRAEDDPARYAHDLYAWLRAMDARGRDLLLVARPPADDAWAAIDDRLRRAAAGTK